MERKSFLSGKRFLINQPMIRSFCGSTVVTLELAKYLSSVGAQVTVYTNVVFPPALSSFEKAGIKVLSPKEDCNISLKDYDYIWVHSLTFPRQLLDELKHPPKKLPAFIFLHMSPLESIPDEHPWIYNLENNLSSLSLYISEGAIESNEKYGLPPKTGFFRNPAPIEFEELAKRKMSQTLQKLLIVSNHPPEEVLKAKKLLVDAGVNVDIYGDGQDEYGLLSPDVLKKYDAVLTIGKTVQYCIVGSMPVYIYDWFGGPGWLTKSNYEHSKSTNFSGRFSVHKTGEEIACEIVDGYSDALKFQLDYLVDHKKEFSIDSVLDGLLKNLKSRKIEPQNSEYIESAKAAVYCAEIRFIASEELGNAYKCCDDLVLRLEDCKKAYDALANSKRMKILDAILKPHDKLKKFLKKS